MALRLANSKYHKNLTPPGFVARPLLNATTEAYWIAALNGDTIGIPIETKLKITTDQPSAWITT
jgi:hypothetical protein